jgi:hypothetical protein
MQFYLFMITSADKTMHTLSRQRNIIIDFAPVWLNLNIIFRFIEMKNLIPS